MAVTLTGDNEITYASFPIEKTETNADGDLVVYGKATDGSVDSDLQIVKPSFAYEAIKRWKDTGANVRVQHNPQRDPAGVGIGVEFDGDATWVKALVVEPVAQKLVSKGVLTAYSVGIARPTIERDAAGKARGGIITGGEIVEISLVDRPANKSCGIQLVKSAGGVPEYVGTVFGDGAVLEKALKGEDGDLDARVSAHLEDARDALAEAGRDQDEDDAISSKAADLTLTFTPNDLAKILHAKVIEQHYDDLAVKAAAEAEHAVYKRDIDTATRRRLAKEGKALADGCLAAETLVATPDGPRRIDSMVGRCIVLTDCGWEPAEVRSFGFKQLFAVTLACGKERRTVYATAGHRWLTERGEWLLTDTLVSGVRIPHVEVLTEGVPARDLDGTKGRVAADAKQSPDYACHVGMVNLESAPALACAGVGSGHFGYLSADGASTVLLRDEGIEVLVGDAILPPQGCIASSHPTRIEVFDEFGADLGAATHAEAAVGTAELAWSADVKVGVRTLVPAGAAHDRTFVSDRHALRVPRRSRSIFRFAESEPATVATDAPSVRVAPALRRLFAIGARARLHASNATRSRTWKVVAVEATSRCEEVFCAVVPDLHRFVLADGILTGNSYPIENAGDLHNAAILARSGHGDVAAAKRLIARRAHELGVANPLDEHHDSKKGEGVADAQVTAGVTKEQGAKEAEAEPAVTKNPPPVKAKKKAKAGGKKVTQDGQEDACKLDHAHTAKCMPSGTPQSASGASDAAPMKEIPDPGAYQYTPMPAGRATPDHKGAAMNPEAAAMLRFKSAGVDPDLGRLHDLTCPAFDPAEVSKYHPYADFASVIDDAVWMRKAVAAATGPLDVAKQMTVLWEAAQRLKSADFSDLNDYRAELHKAFRDANPGPSSYPSPGAMSPQKYNRPPLTAGHAADSPGYGPPNTSPEVATSPPNAAHFDRPPLAAGHQTPSPSFMKASWEYPHEQGVPVRLTYAVEEREKNRRALSLMHDYVSRMFPPLCPMDEQDPYRVDGTKTPPAAVKTAVPSSAKGRKKLVKRLGKKVMSGRMTLDEARARVGSRMSRKAEKQLQAAARQARPAAVTKAAVIPAAAPGPVQPDVIKSAVADAIAPLLAKMAEQGDLLARQDSKIAEQEKRWEAVARLGDPQTDPFSGIALNMIPKNARPAGVPAQAEIAERTQQMIRNDLYRTWRTTDDPAEREAVYATLQKYGMPGLVK